ncbi:hypothetical protein NM208_g6543 [Fusarium decemcellulare]|uniref:Uncharacterized protein n=1 Tax=Fusarium decemcellulare TaxID=57161 RepID=A0ACC1SCI7_9HYPO|nr:hypothetical protein NM208_g6543 [Fusarium decemcellulare]
MSAFEAFLAERTKLGTNDIPGCVLSSVNEHGQYTQSPMLNLLVETISPSPAPLVDYGFVLIYGSPLGDSLISTSSGYDSVEPGALPIHPDGIFWIASCSKLIGAIAALQCVERGQITLDEPVDGILPELSNLSVFRETTVTESRENKTSPHHVDPTTKRITLRQLICHTSGIGYDFIHPKLMAWRDAQGQQSLGLSGKLIEGYSTPLLFTPGDGWAYGGGLDWAGEMVSRLNKVSLEEYLQKNVFEPLGMKSTTFRLERYPEIQRRLISTAERGPEGVLRPTKRLWPDIARDDCVGAGLYSSVSDYEKILLDIIKDKPTLLRKGTVEAELFSAQFHDGERPLQQLRDAFEIIQLMGGANDVDADDVNWSLGGLYISKSSSFTKKNSIVWGGLPNMFWMANRDHGLAAVYASQVLPPGDAKSVALARDFFEQTWKQKSSTGV